MTPKQFEVIARILRSHGKNHDAARLVLIEGMTPVAATRATAHELSSVCNALKRFRSKYAEINEAWSSKADES